jgi:ribonuclease R
VELDDIFIEGLLHVTELGSDYFTYDKQKHAMVGERSNIQYRLGDRLKVKVVRVDLETSKIDFSLVGGEKKIKTNKVEKKKNVKKRR